MQQTSRPRAITMLSTTIIIFGVYNLLGVGSYKSFAVMFKPVPNPLIVAIYGFTVLYGICGIYCGSRMLRFEDWARKIMVGMTTVSLLLGFALNNTVMGNFKEMIESGQAKVPPDMEGSVYVYAVVIMAIITLFELAIVFYFTRPKVTAAFK